MVIDIQEIYGAALRCRTESNREVDVEHRVHPYILSNKYLCTSPSAKVDKPLAEPEVRADEIGKPLGKKRNVTNRISVEVPAKRLM